MPARVPFLSGEKCILRGDGVAVGMRRRKGIFKRLHDFGLGLQLLRIVDKRFGGVT